MDVRVKLTVKDIFSFSIYHFYKSTMGVISIFCTLAVILVTVAYWSLQSGLFQVILLTGVILVAGSQPFILYRKAVRQTKDPALSREILLKFDYSGFKAQQGKDKAAIRWSQLLKVKRIPGMYVLYLEKGRAYLLPDWALSGDKKRLLLELIRAHVNEKKRKGI